MSARPKPHCAEALAWLKANGHDLAPLTGQDRRALQAIAHTWELYSTSDDDGQRGALAAVRALLSAMQPKCRPLARELIAHTMDWGDRDKLWPKVTGPRIVEPIAIIKGGPGDRFTKAEAEAAAAKGGSVFTAEKLAKMDARFYEREEREARARDEKIRTAEANLHPLERVRVGDCDDRVDLDGGVCAVCRAAVAADPSAPGFPVAHLMPKTRVHPVTGTQDYCPRAAERFASSEGESELPLAEEIRAAFMRTWKPGDRCIAAMEIFYAGDPVPVAKGAIGTVAATNAAGVVAIAWDGRAGGRPRLTSPDAITPKMAARAT